MGSTGYDIIEGDKLTLVTGIKIICNFLALTFFKDPVQISISTSYLRYIITVCTRKLNGQNKLPILGALFGALIYTYNHDFP